MTPQEKIKMELAQRIISLKLRREAVQKIIEHETSMVNKLGPLYNAAIKNLEEALKTQLEIDTLLGYTEQLIIDAESKVKASIDNNEN